jgi:vacuolar-type H+-ATPase subunit B/Vma2
VVTVANVWLANETNDRRVMLSVFDANGEVVSHQILDLGEKVEAIRLFKATQGYWLIGTTYVGLDENLYLAKLSSTFAVERIVTLLGSNQDRFVTTPLVNNDLDFVFLVNTYSKDQDYLSLSTTTESSSVVFITLTAST